MAALPALVYRAVIWNIRSLTKRQVEPFLLKVFSGHCRYWLRALNLVTFNLLPKNELSLEVSQSAARR